MMRGINSDDRYIYIYCPGAGDLRISKSSEVQCGGKIGFSIGVEWGKHEFTGGIIPKEDAIKLAEYILTYASKQKIRKIKLNKISSMFLE